MGNTKVNFYYILRAGEYASLKAPRAFQLEKASQIYIN